VPKNQKTAAKWLALVAEQDFPRAQYILGNMYRTGKGVSENDKTAVKWYTLAAEQGDADAQDTLGVMYRNGRGVLTDNLRAYMWFNLGSYNGNEQAGKNKDIISKKMSYSDIQQAKYMSRRCLESNYTDC